MALITHDARLAFDAATGAIAENVLGAVYLDTDVSLTTPLEVTIFGAGSTTTTITSDIRGVIPEFTLDQATNGLTGEEGVRLVWASGAHRTVLLSTSRIYTALTTLEAESPPVGLVRYVDATNGDDSNAGHSRGTAMATIQAAVDDLAGPGTVLVAAGTYAPVTVTTSGVTIESLAGRRATIIQTASTTANGVTFLGTGPAGLDTVRQSKLKGFKVVGPGQGSAGTGVGVYVKWSSIDLVVEDCWITTWGSHGVLVEDSYSMSFVRTLADYNGGDGFHGETNFNNITFDRTLTLLNSGRGYAVVGGTTCLFLNADAESNVGAGFDLRYVFAANLVSCHMEKNGTNGTSPNIYLHWSVDFNSPCTGVNIKGCLIQGQGVTVRGLVIDGANRTSYEDNWFNNHVTDHVQITSNGARTFVGPNTYAGTGTKLTDASFSTARMEYDASALSMVTNLLRLEPRSSVPAVPTQGHLWWSSTLNQLRAWDATRYRTLFSGVEGTATLSPASIPAHSSSDSTITATGAVVGDRVAAGAPTLQAGLVWSAFVSAADTVTVRIANVTTGAIVPTSGAWRVAVLKA